MTTNTFSIRPARPADVPDILAMIRELATFENLEDTLQVTAASLQSALFGPTPAASALVAMVGPETAGYAIFYSTFSSFTGRQGIFLEDIYVRPVYRKRGIGKGMIEHVAQIAAKRGCKRYEWLALNWNENALRLYTQLGAKTLDDWVFLRMEEPQIHALAGKPTHAVAST